MGLLRDESQRRRYLDPHLPRHRRRFPRRRRLPDVDHGWISGSRGVIRRTTNGGASWTVQTGNTTQHLFNLDMTDLQTGWIVGDVGTILWTTNGGDTWSPQASPVNAALKWIDMVDDTRLGGGNRGDHHPLLDRSAHANPHTHPNQHANGDANPAGRYGSSGRYGLPRSEQQWPA
ncbi:MAG: hypothetical protein HZY76_08730 [Anaerolineae bacterium]|nr:MAG: hypothetical protein HZY76_08730 [Anaerolineae bacterium]